MSITVTARGAAASMQANSVPESRALKRRLSPRVMDKSRRLRLSVLSTAAFALQSRKTEYKDGLRRGTNSVIRDENWAGDGIDVGWPTR